MLCYLETTRFMKQCWELMWSFHCLVFTSYPLAVDKIIFSLVGLYLLENISKLEQITFEKRKLLDKIFSRMNNIRVLCQTVTNLSFSECSRHLFSVEALTLSWRRSLSYRNQSIHLLCKSMDWFLYDRDLCHEIVKAWRLKEWSPYFNIWWAIRTKFQFYQFGF